MKDQLRETLQEAAPQLLEVLDDHEARLTALSTDSESSPAAPLAQGEPEHTHGLCHDPACGPCRDSRVELGTRVRDQTRKQLTADLGNAVEWMGDDAVAAGDITFKALEGWIEAGRPAPPERDKTPTAPDSDAIKIVP